MRNNTEIPQGYKDSPLGLIPEDWEVRRLGDFGEVCMCKRIMKHQTSPQGDIPFYKIGTFGGMPDAYIDKQLYEDYKKRYPYPMVGDVLISAAGTIGRTVIYDGTPSYYQDSNIVWIKNDNSRLLNQYLFYFYDTVKWITDTGTIPRVYNSALKSIQIQVPPIAEQRQICSVIQLWDTAIEKQTELIEKLRLRKQGLMQQLLTGKKRLPCFTSKWKTVRLGEVCSWLRNVTFSREQLNGTNGKCQNVHYGDVLIKYQSILNCENVELPYVNNDIELKSTYDFVKDGDIIMSDTAEDETVGKACEAINVGNRIILAGLHTMLIRPKPGIFAPCFLGYYINSEAYHKQLLPLIQGIKVCSLGKQSVQNTILAIPSMKEQTEIVTILSSCDQEIQSAIKKKTEFQSQKRGLMQQLLIGKKRIK